MKEVLAVIRMNKMNETKQALADAGVSSFTARKVMGRGQGKVDYRLLRGAEDGHEEAINQLGPGPKLIPKRLVSVVVPDVTVQRGEDDYRSQPHQSSRRRKGIRDARDGVRACADRRAQRRGPDGKPCLTEGHE